ncbi:MAG: hypothetical protein VB071_00475 [Lawsonibacter sp.]|nr:hypothetical protein [Lawsonibacter sp.]
MKLVIVECNKKSAVALRDDGTFVKVAQRGYRIGQTLESMPAPRRIERFHHMAIAAAVTVLLLSGAAFATWEPYSYVTMDVNPSIKFALNVFDRVLSVTAVNEDAEPIVSALNQEDKSFCGLDDIIEMTIEQCRTDGYLDQDDENYVVFSAMSRSDRRTDALSENLKNQNFGDGLISAEIVPSTMEALKEAEQQGTTPGKLALIRRMQKKTGDSKAIQRWINTPVREILDAEKASPETNSAVPGGTQSNQPDNRDTSVTVGPAEKQEVAAPNIEQPKHSGNQSKTAPSEASQPPQEAKGGKQEKLQKDEVGQTPTADPGGEMQLSPPESGETSAPEAAQPGNAQSQGKGGESAPGALSDSRAADAQDSAGHTQAKGKSGN